MLAQAPSQHSRFSFWQLFLLLALLTFSCLGVWSTEVAQNGDLMLFVRHVLSIVLGLLGFFAMSLYGYQRVTRWGPALYGVLLLLLLLVLLFAPSVAGSRRWLYLPGFSFQPSEFAKLVLVITLSAHLARLQRLSLSGMLLLPLHILLPCALVFRQPDLGMTLVLTAVLLSMLLVSPASLWFGGLLVLPGLSVFLFWWGLWAWRLHLVLGVLWLAVWALRARWQRQTLDLRILGLAGILSLNVLVVGGGNFLWQQLRPYQQQRILTFVSPNPDPLSSGYQVIQSTIAVGSGGLTGQGLFRGSQTQLGFVPEQHTDFIFSALAEETGFLGAGCLLLLFALLIFRILWIGFQAQSLQQLYICTGVATLMLMQILINVGMNMDAMPVKGVPLPLISYGGSSMLIQLCMLGLVESIYLQQQRGDLVLAEGEA